MGEVDTAAATVGEVDEKCGENAIALLSDDGEEEEEEESEGLFI